MNYSTELEQTIFIDSFKTSVVNIPLKQPMHLSFGNVDTRPSGLVELEVSSDAGRSAAGLGEGVTLPQPLFTDDSGLNIANNTAEFLQYAQRMHTGQNCSQLVGALRNYNFESDGLYPTARLAIEMALLDGYSRLYDLSLQRLIGVDNIKEVPYGKSIGGVTQEEILSQAHSALANNAKKIKLKIMPDNFGAVMRSIKNLQSAYQDIELMVDANGGFDPHEKADRQMIAMLDDQGLVMIEEPVSRVGQDRGLDAVRTLRAKMGELTTPICLDDCLADYASCIQAVDQDLADVVNVKPGRIGSFLSSIDLIDYCSEIGKQVMIGGMFEATPGRCLTVILGAYCLKQGFTIPGDLSLAQERLNGDLTVDVRQLTYGPNGGIIMPSGLGWGY